MSENAYYIPGESSGKVKLPKGEYEATIINLEMVNNIKCGDFIADIFDLLPEDEKNEYDSQLNQIEEIVHRVKLNKEV